MNKANEILKQLGGNKFIAITGAQCYADGDTLVAKFKGSNKANIMYVTPNVLDLYDVKICKFKNLDLAVVSEMKNIYADMLGKFFTNVTGLCISL